MTGQPDIDPALSSALHFLGSGQRNPSGTVADELHYDWNMAAFLPAQTHGCKSLHKQGSVHVWVITRTKAERDI